MDICQNTEIQLSISNHPSNIADSSLLVLWVQLIISSNLLDHIDSKYLNQFDTFVAVYPNTNINIIPYKYKYQHHFLLDKLYFTEPCILVAQEHFKP